MTPERLQFIKDRLMKNQSAPDAAALGLELCEALGARLQPVNAAQEQAHAFSTPTAFKSGPDGEALLVPPEEPAHPEAKPDESHRSESKSKKSNR